MSVLVAVAVDQSGLWGPALVVGFVGAAVVGVVAAVAVVAGYDRLGCQPRVPVDAVGGLGCGIAVGYLALAVAPQPSSGFPAGLMFWGFILLGAVCAAAVSVTTAPPETGSPTRTSE